ncbi:uncharacterized protein LOC101847456 [Aplysia californica]|uniref:Uncharacterized protein LOC101847456 n=1 Tax=Aplysia californica TaxID=6500 RepID=A0ABM0K6S3_APLCA|nr:uncharacterized protein LOC101847456 [Aplysia californica]
MADDADFSLDAAEATVSGVEAFVQFPNETAPQLRMVPVETDPETHGGEAAVPLTVAQVKQQLFDENNIAGNADSLKMILIDNKGQAKNLKNGDPIDIHIDEIAAESVIKFA